MYRIVWIFVVWAIAVSLSYFLNSFWPQLISILVAAVIFYKLKLKDNVEITILWLALFITFPSLIIKNWNQILYIYSIVVPSVYLLCLGWFACRTNDHTKKVFNEKKTYATIVKTLGAITLIVTSIIVAYTTELYSLIPSGLLVVGLFIEKIDCGKAFAGAPNNTKSATYKMSNQEQEHLFGINAL